MVRKHSLQTHPATLPQTAASSLFNVENGKVMIHGIFGEVTTAIQAQANNTKLVANPDTGSDVDLCAVLDLTGDAVGAVYGITGDLSDAMLEAAAGAPLESVNDYKPVVVSPGTIDLNCAASSTGRIKWTVVYSPIDPGAHITRA